jgi:hypothetical protein
MRKRKRKGIKRNKKMRKKDVREYNGKGRKRKLEEGLMN